ncbi:MAG: sialidase family protein [Bacteroidota bacterium]
MKRLMHSWVCLILVLVSPLVQAQITNKKIGDWKGSSFALSPSVAVSHKDPANIVVGVGSDRVVYSVDSGKTWSESQLTSGLSGFGNATIVPDNKGQLLHFSLAGAAGTGNASAVDRILFQRSPDGGKTWVDLESIMGKNPSVVSAVADVRKQPISLVWAEFDQADGNKISNVRLSRSSGGKKWSEPTRINLVEGDGSGTSASIGGPMATIDKEGRIFVTWSNGGSIFFDRSYDGEMWLNNDITVAKQVGGWALEIPGIGITDQSPVLMSDHGTGAFHGSIYVVWADQKNGTDDTDIWMMRSLNRGDNWTALAKINQDGGGKHQFSPWMTVDQTTGYIYVVYFDRRNYDDDQTDVYLAFSMDGGAKFTEKKISEQPFTPTGKSPGRLSIAAHKGVIVPVWTRPEQDGVSIWTSVIRLSQLVAK